MDQFNELMSLFKNRIKVPLYSSVLFSFAIYNWKVFFFLIFSKYKIEEKFKYYDDEITWCSYIIPIIVGFSFTIASPRIQKIMFNLVYKQKYELAESKIKYKAKLHKLERKLSAEQEETIIERAQRDAKIENITNEDVKQKLKEEIEKKRNSQNKDVNTTPTNKNAIKKFTKNSVLGNAEYTLTLTELHEIDTYINTINQAIDNGANLPSTTFGISGFSNDIHIAIDGKCFLDETQSYHSKTHVFITKDTFKSLLHGEKFSHVVSRNGVKQIFGDLSTLNYLPEFFKKVSQTT